MLAPSTQHLWLGWLDPKLCCEDNDAVTDDVMKFVHACPVSEVIPERNGARIGAFVKLAEPIGRATFETLSWRLYHGECRITVDDQQPNNPRCKDKVCPRLTGPSRYCRGWNIRGHHAWQWGCSFSHPPEKRPTHGATYSMEEVKKGSAKYDEIETELLRETPFCSADGSLGRPKILRVCRVVNRALERQYEARRNFLKDKHSFVVERELWHGTNCKALPELLTHGLQPPADTCPSEACPLSGGKGLCTTLCGTACKHCSDAHCWDKCHMYGLGVYLADQAQKSHRYVRGASMEVLPAVPARAFRWQVVLAGKYRDFDDALQQTLEDGHNAGRQCINYLDRGYRYSVSLNTEPPCQVNLSTGRKRDVRRLVSEPSATVAAEEEVGVEAVATDQELRPVYSLLRCRVCLGNPYLIEGNLLRADAMHNTCWCQDPTDMLETCAETWCTAKGHDSFYVRGLAGSHKAGLGVYNSEYVVFQPYQILPLYQVDYILE